MGKKTKMKEITADQVLSLVFMSAGNNAIIGYREIDEFYKMIKELEDKNRMNVKLAFSINMPMRDNFDLSLFEEIKEGENSGKFIMLKAKNKQEKEIQKQKLLKQYFNFTGSDITLIKEVKDVMKRYSILYNINNKENLLTRVKELVIRK